MLAHAREEDPRECVGLLLGGGSVAELALPLENVSQTPRTAYRADPRRLLKALRQADDAGLEVLAVYHSHPGGPALPSVRDRTEAVWDTLYVIIGGATGEVRVFRLPQGEEVELDVCE